MNNAFGDIVSASYVFNCSNMNSILLVNSISGAG